MTEPKQPPRTLRVVIRDDSPMIFCQDLPTYRSVAIELTDDQLRQLSLLWVGSTGGKAIHESVSRVFFDEPPILPPPKPLDIATELPAFEPPSDVWRKAKPFTIGRRVLSGRATKCLARAGIFTVDELLRYPGSVLLKIRNFGATTLQEVEEALQAIGKELPVTA